MLGSSFFYEKYVLEKYLAKLPNCKTILLTGSYHTLHYNMSNENYTKRRYEYFHYLGADYKLPSFDWQKIFLVNAISFSGAMTNLLRDFKSPKKELWKKQGYIGSEDVIDKTKINFLAEKKIEKHHELIEIILKDY